MSLLAMLFTIVALAAVGSASVEEPNWWPRAGVDGQFLPIQFNRPEDLGVGKLLVASRGLGDPDFARTVVLLVQYDEKGVIGLILNRRTDVPISRVLDLKAAKDRSDPVYLGGPVAPSAAFGLFKSSGKVDQAEKIFGGVYFISDKARFEQTLSGRPGPGVFHVYLGYAGWNQDQLRSEVRAGGWFVFPADAGMVFNADPESLWLQMIQKAELQLAGVEPAGETALRGGVGGLSRFPFCKGAAGCLRTSQCF